MGLHQQEYGDVFATNHGDFANNDVTNGSVCEMAMAMAMVMFVKQNLAMAMFLSNINNRFFGTEESKQLVGNK